MIKKLVIQTLNSFENHPIEIKLYDEFFGIMTQSFENYTLTIEDNRIKLNNQIITYSEILSIDLNADDETRIELIGKAVNSFVAYQIAKGHLVGTVIEALDEKLKEFKKTRKEQESELRELIKLKLRLNRLNLSVDEVLRHLVSNTPNVMKNDIAFENSVMRELIENIDGTINKIRKVSIF